MGRVLVGEYACLIDQGFPTRRNGGGFESHQELRNPELNIFDLGNVGSRRMLLPHASEFYAVLTTE
jgi:hypothetical protein